MAAALYAAVGTGPDWGTGAGLYALYKTDNPVTTTAKRFVDWLHAATQKDVQA